MPDGLVQRTVFSDFSFGLSLLCNESGKEMKMSKELNCKTQFKQMSLRLINDPEPTLSESNKEALIVALATLIIDVASSDGVKQGAAKDEQQNNL
jgi:hypothetical protein